MANDVISTLDLDKQGLSGKIVLVKEIFGCDSSFFHSCFIAKQIRGKSSICLVTLHNDFNHYYNVGMKMGYNLKSLKESGSFINIDFLEIVSKLENTKCLTESLFKHIENTINELNRKSQSITIIIDDLTHLLNLDCGVSQINNFVLRCRDIIVNNKEFCLILGVHVTSNEDESFIISQLVAHMSDVICEVSNLKTGRSVDVSGSFKILKPWSDNDTSQLSKFMNLKEYLFKLYDRGVKVFAPGLL